MSRKHTFVVPGFTAIMLLGLLLLACRTAYAEEIIAPPFAAYYWEHHGERVLGAVNAPPMEINGYLMQYFEKGRLEDHRHETSDPTRAVAYSPLTLEMMQHAPYLQIDGMPITYGELQTRSAQQHAPPPGFVAGTMALEQGIFIPADPNLNAAPGYIVPFQFWTYINRSYLFPGGWQHDVGLPVTNAFDILVPAADGSEKRIVMQAFERTVLTLDLSNVYGWPVARVNIGTDALWVQGTEPMVQHPSPPPTQPAGPKRIEVSLQQQWLYAYEGERLVMDVPVSTGKDGFETPPGSFAIYSKIPRKTLRGNYNGESWNVPDVPHILFYRGGFAIHGVYWHDRFGTGERYSHGCVGIAPYDALALYEWAPHGTPIIVY
jgi:hypothetical protein